MLLTVGWIGRACMTSLLVVLVAAAFALGGAQQPLVGTWEVNPDESDDVEEEIRRALASADRDRGRRRRRGAPVDRPDPNDPIRAVDRLERVIDRLSAAADRLTIDLVGDELQIAAEGAGRVRIFYLDGEEHVRQTPDGTTLKAKARWDGRRIVVEQKGERGVEIVETYQQGSEPDILIVNFRLEAKRFDEPLVIRSVYDRLPAFER